LRDIPSERIARTITKKHGAKPATHTAFRTNRPTGRHHAPVCISITSERAKRTKNVAMTRAVRRAFCGARWNRTATITANASQSMASQPLKMVSTTPVPKDGNPKSESRRAGKEKQKSKDQKPYRLLNSDF